MNKILSILAVWLCSVTVFAQLNGGDDWNLPDNPGLVTKKISVGVNNAGYGTASVTTATTYGTGIYPVGSKVAISATASTGYHFVAWTVGEDTLATTASYTYTMPDQDVTVTANFAPNKYTVKFIADGTEIQSQSLDYGSPITAPADPTKEGYTFKKWNKDVAATVPAEDVTYTAVFEVNKYKVTFNIEGVEYSSSSMDFGATITAPADVAKTGYTFSGWTTDATVPAHDVAYNATYSINQYNVAFIADGKTVKGGKQDYASAIVAPEDPVKEGYTFKGWTPTVSATVPANDVTYTAVFDINKYDVVFTVDGSEYSKSTLEYGAAITAPASPSKAGYTFGGWTPDATVPAHNVSYDATYTVNQYTVAFVSDSTTVKSGKQDFGSAITAPADPTKEGYTFRGWTPAVSATVPANDVTYTAVFDINKYNVVFTVEGAEYSKSTLEYGAAITAPDAPSKTGYTFGGWTPDATVPAHDVSYDGVYNINKYKVTFNADNGTENIVNTLEYGSAITAPADPTKTGYSFNGWTPAVAETVPANDVTYTANWKVNSYKLSFVVDGVATESKVDFGTKITLPENPTKEGYVFDAWTPAVAETMPAEDVTYTATWKLAKYKVAFVVDGNNVYSDSLEYGSPITAPADPTKEGYNFLGWNPSVDATVPAHDVTYTASFGKGAFLVKFVVDGKDYSTASMDFGELIVLPETDPTKTGYTFAGWEGYAEGALVPAENVTYNATWTINKYKVTFDVDGTLAEDSLAYGSAITAPENPTKTGYSFDGWTPAVAETVPANDVTYTATWKVNKYKFTLEVDDKVFYTTEVEYNTSIPTIDSTPEKEGYTFDSWDGLSEYTLMPADSLTFTAKWIANKYSVTFKVDNDTVKCDTLDFGTAIVAPENPTKDGYVFDGWTPALAETVPANNVTYTASFKIKRLTVTFIVDEDTVKTEELDFGASITAPEDPTKGGYTFAGWTPEVALTMPAEDATYTATWTINKYNVTFISDGVVIKTDTLDFNSPITAPEDPTKDGYTFDGWTPTVDEAVPSNDVTYTAVWTINKYSVSFIDGNDTIKSETLEYGTGIIAPENPTKEGYEFTGWSPAVAETVPAEDVTYTATWIANKFTITFMDGNDTIKSETLEYGAVINAPANPTKEGYTFAGWNPAVDESVPSYDLTYTATWTVNKYTLTFIVDGDTVKSELVEYGAEIVAPENPTKEGYEFTGWSPSVDETMPAEDVTYTATWQIPVGIKTISLADAPEGTYYTIKGMKVARPTKAGLYIVNGVKMIIK